MKLNQKNNFRNKWKNKSFWVVFSVSFFLFIFSFFSVFPGLVYGAAGVPKIVNFQGRLLDSSGNLLGGTGGTDYCYKFSIYDAVSAGSKIWPSGSPSTMTISTREGVFNANVGDVSAGGDTLDLTFTDDQAFINIEVATKVGSTCAPGDGAESFETLSPRQRIASSAFAINSGTVGGFTPATSATGSQIPVLTSGSLVLGDTNPGLRVTGSNTLTLQSGVTGDIQFYSSSNKITSSGALTIAGGFTSSSGAITFGGLAGGGTQCLQTDNSGVITATGAGCGTGAVTWNSITNPTGTQSLTFDDGELNAWTVNSDTETFQTITANSLTTGKVLAISSSSLSSGSLIDLAVTGTAAASNTQKALNISTSGANATSTQTTYGAYLSNTHTGTSSTNVGLYATASGGTNNYAGLFGGDVYLDEGANRTFGVKDTTSGVGFDLTIRAGSGSGTFDGGKLILKGTDTFTPGDVYVYGGDGDSTEGKVILSHTGGTPRGKTTIGSTTATSLFNVGSSAQFQINTTGAIVAATGITSTGTISLTSANTTQTTTSSAVALNLNSLTSGTGLYAASSTLSSGSLIDLAVTGTAAASNTQKVLNISTSGANATSTQTTYGAYLSNTHTGTSSTNVGLYATASGGTNNYAAIFDGRVGIYTSTPTTQLDVVGSGYFSNNLKVGDVITTPALYLSFDGITENFFIYDDGENEFESAGNPVNFFGASKYTFDNNFGIGDNTPASLFTVGSGDLFQVNSSGDILTASGENLSITTGTTGVLTLDSGTTGTVNLATGNNAKTLNIGTGTAGNAINIGTNNTTSDTISIGSALDNVAITGDSWSVTDAGALTVVSCTGCGGGSSAWNSITNPTGTQSLTFDDAELNAWTVNSDTETFQTITANSLTTGKVLGISSSSLSSGSLIDLVVTGTAAASNTQKALNISTSGANATSSQTTYGGYLSNTHTGTSSTNVGLYATASGGTNNYAAIFNGGNVGIGTTSPGQLLDIQKAGVANSFVGIQTLDTSEGTNSGILVGSLRDGGNAYSLPGLWLGTASPSYTNYAFLYDGTRTIFNTPSSKEFKFRVNNSDKVTINTSGDVGIGDTTPASLLTVGNGDLFQVNSSGAIVASTGYIQSSGTMSLTSANTTQTTTSSALALNLNSLTSGTGLYAASSTLSSGSLVDLAVTGTAAASNTQKVLNVSNSGANSTSTQTTYGGYFSNTRTGTSSTNVGLYATASGGTNNYAAIFNGGNVGIGTTTPLNTFDVQTTSGNTTVAINTAAGATTSYGVLFVGSQSGGRYFQLASFGASAAGTRYGTSLAGMNELSSFGANGFIIGSGTAAPVIFGVNTSEVMRLSSTGLVGIGDADPASLLTVGNGDLFQVNSSGAIVAATGITSSGTITLSSISGSTQCLQVNSSGVVSGTGAGCGGGGGGLTVGTTAITSGGTNRVLFENGSNILSESADFTYDGTTLGVATASTTASNKALNISQTGATSGTDYGGYFSNTGGATTNVGLYTTASGGTTNLGLNVDSGQTLLGGTTLSAGTLAKLNIVSTNSSNGVTTAIAGIHGDYTFTNGGASSYVQVGNRFVFNNTPTTNANTMVGEIIRTVDNTVLANLVRGIEVTSNAGSNTSGTNTGIRTTGATFGIQAITNGSAGSVSLPAAIFGENTGTTQGDILRLYTSSMTSAPQIAQFYHDTSTFSGTGLLMDFASGSGTFSGNFLDFQKNNTSLFKVTNGGVTSLGFTTSQAYTSAVCSNLANATAPTADVQYTLYDCGSTPVADYAEMYPVETGVEFGDIVVTGTELVATYDTTNGIIDWNKLKGNITKLVKSDRAYQGNVIGIVSDNYGDFSSTGYNIKEIDNPMPVALVGRVPVKISQSSFDIKAGDYITTSSESGRGMKAIKAGTVIGKALEDWTAGSGVDTVMVFVEQGYFNGVSATSFAGIDINTIDSENIGKEILAHLILEENNIDTLNLSEIFTDRLVAGLEIVTPDLVAKNINTNNLIVEENAKFAGLTDFIGEVSFMNKVSFDNVVEFKSPPIFNNDTAGFATVTSGTKKVEVIFDNPYMVQPVVNVSISLEDDLENENENMTEEEINNFFSNDIKYVITNKTQNGFTININKEYEKNIKFSWVALAVDSAKNFESLVEGLVIENNSNDNIPTTNSVVEDDSNSENQEEGIETSEDENTNTDTNTNEEIVTEDVIEEPVVPVVVVEETTEDDPIVE